MKSFLVLIIVFVVKTTFPQLVTNSNVTPINLVNNVLLGSGVNATNISYTGSNTAIGFFNSTSSNVGLDSGIIMTTGTVNNQINFGIQEGPFGPNNNASAGVDNIQPGSTLLSPYSGGTTTNAAVLQFDFVATGNQVSFEYVFASDEYLEYVGQGFNDVFAFIISGPGITGNQNIAIIPGTTSPVTIDNLNSTTNSTYYIDNGDGNSAPQNTNNTIIQYDGLTTVLTAKANVQCGQSYHIIIAISDVQDGSVDSGVFLGAESFTSTAPFTSIVSTNSPNSSNNELLEGCSNASMLFVREDSLAIRQAFNFTYLGAGINGTDYLTLPDSLIFAVGEDSVTINLQTINDAIPEGTEEVIITTEYENSCGQQVIDSIVFQIKDQIPIILQMPEDDTIFCLSSDTITLTPIVSGGAPNYTYNWSTGGITPSITVIPSTDTIYLLTITDVCGTQTIIDTVRVTIVESTPISITSSNDTTINCPGDSLQLFVTSSGGTGTISYSWNHGLGNSDTVNIITSTIDSLYIVTVTDQCNNIAVDTIIVKVLTPMSISSYGDTIICPYGNAVIGVKINGGFEPYKYKWTASLKDTSEIKVSPSIESYFYVSVYDSCNSYFVEDSILVKISKPTADFTSRPSYKVEKLPVYFINTSNNSNSYLWLFGNNKTSSQTNENTTYITSGEYIVTLIAYDSIGCSDTITKKIIILPEYFGYVPNSFSPNNDNINDTFKGTFVGAKELELQIYDRWGNLIFHSIELDSSWNGESHPIGVYIYSYKLRDYVGKLHEYRGHINLIR